MSIVKVEVNCATGEVIETPLTEAEIAQREIEAAAATAAYEAKKSADDAALAAEAAARESAHAKLAALGLTEAEVAALVK
jgi:hypothetical protein